MKQFKIIVPILTIILQITLVVPLPASLSENTKSENSIEILNTTTSMSPDVAIETFKQALNLTKEFIQRSESITTNVLKSMEQLKDINTTQTYKDYKTNLEDYLKSINSYQTVRGNCFGKSQLTSMEFMVIIVKFIEEDERNNLSSEDLEMEKLFQQHGLKDLITAMDDWKKSFNMTEVLKAFINMAPEDSKKLINLLEEEC